MELPSGISIYHIAMETHDQDNRYNRDIIDLTGPLRPK